MFKKILFFLSILAVFLVFSFVPTSFFKENLSKKILISNNSPFLNPENNKENKVLENMLFVGDMMFDRGVEALIKQNKEGYLFNKIGSWIKGFSQVVGNLEGPIVFSPPDFGPQSMQFAFPESTTALLKKNHFTAVSLANNHSLNMGREGLEETRVLLEKDGIDYFGDPVQYGEEFVLRKEEFVLFGFNATYASTFDMDAMLQLVKNEKDKSPDKIFIAFMHWGQEYQSSNSSFQQEIAHKLIENGINLIVGSHPHVVQNIEQYHNGLIFYSLGNFIFDQFFSKETQEGLALNAQIRKREISLELYPVRSEKSQPFLLLGKEKESFLRDIASRSDPELLSQIRLGIIKMKRS